MHGLIKFMQFTDKAVEEYAADHTGTTARTVKLGILEGLFAALDALGVECVWGMEGKACHLDGFYYNGNLYDPNGGYVRQMPKASKV